MRKYPWTKLTINRTNWFWSVVFWERKDLNTIHHNYLIMYWIKCIIKWKKMKQNKTRKRPTNLSRNSYFCCIIHIWISLPYTHRQFILSTYYQIAIFKKLFWNCFIYCFDLSNTCTFSLLKIFSSGATPLL